MTHAALVIQNRYRSYCEHKRFKKLQTQNATTSNVIQRNQDAQCLQNFCKFYQQDQHSSSGSTSKEASSSGPLK